MIDLTKPIRPKGNEYQVGVQGPLYRLVCGSVSRSITLQELEANYENIPEPRKPRVFRVKARSDGYPYVDGGYLRPGYCAIEWPEGAPIPDWPEGYP